MPRPGQLVLQSGQSAPDALNSAERHDSAVPRHVFHDTLEVSVHLPEAALLLWQRTSTEDGLQIHPLPLWEVY